MIRNLVLLVMVALTVAIFIMLALAFVEVLRPYLDWLDRLTG